SERRTQRCRLMRYFPFLKWAGGKRWLANYARLVTPAQHARYFEPFLGGGAMFAALQPRDAVLGDLNGDLINCYRVMQADWHSLLEAMRENQVRHSIEFYY